MSDLVWSRDGLDWPHREASRFVEAGGFRWHVQRMGSPAAPAILLIHGTGAASHSWRGLAPLLARHYHVVAPDLPGHGFTQAPRGHRMSLPGMASDLAALLRVLQVAPQWVVGHSAGAAIGARICLDGAIDPKILFSLNGAFLPYGGPAASFFSPLAKMLVLNPFVPSLFAWQAGHRGAVERLIGNTGSTIDPAGIKLYGRLVSSPHHVAAALRMMANWDLEPLLKALPHLKPLLVLVAAEGDRAIPPSVAVKVREILPKAVIERIPALGHLAHEERPALIAALIERYAEKPENIE
ncbi:magnesium chelatase accessory protein [Rhodopseudomonas thermotolerans]|uniref:Magnesium chelatase accessory protein n=2 Tax=Rhodopseudomonas TaxID=1073 RepID=A0A336JN05_9BRAD|nr:MULTISPECIES: alpha/beta fold hydrolase BchO [Rhodopseudomonas]RED35298.1 magnesium chelatase accessory protein [Rhodopseudomonas pentothenatexigens]REG03141.1 magnesium chelatase accessory protein [Rhodopseudomonas thermotolerans]SSW90988.1 magnesium chelatase accessory protein [Rhodopseudomonas pentothenatexigens]